MPSNLRALEMRDRIYRLVSRIPRGKVVSYKHIAEVLKLKDIRLVGWVLNKNYSPSIPCHRVVKSNGEVGGYNRGVSEKIRKLKEEGVKITKKGNLYYVDTSYFYFFTFNDDKQDVLNK